jgi:hypothetical protein
MTSDNTMTAAEVRAMQPIIRQRFEKIERRLQAMFVPAYQRAFCVAVLGFCKPHNRSRKRLARLKHSLTMIVVNPPAWAMKECK